MYFKGTFTRSNDGQECACLFVCVFVHVHACVHVFVFICHYDKHMLRDGPIYMRTGIYTNKIYINAILCMSICLYFCQSVCIYVCLSLCMLFVPMIVCPLSRGWGGMALQTLVILCTERESSMY